MRTTRRPHTKPVPPASTTRHAPDVWTIALAAGAGTRLAPVTGGIPKQFWHPRRRPSLLDDTLTRLSAVTTPGRSVTIVDASHYPYIEPESYHRPPSHVIYQPMNRGTAVGVLLPLLYVLRASPDAIVVITPADHGIRDERTATAGLNEAVRLVRTGVSELILLGVEPTSAATDYGWITTGAEDPDVLHGWHAVAGFCEKPRLATATRLLASGHAVWNTMILVARASALLQRFRRHLPVHAEHLIRATRRGRPQERRALTEAYRDLPPADFSRDVLTVTRPLGLITWPASIGWSDLGTPDRLRTWLTGPRRHTAAAGSAAHRACA